MNRSRILIVLGVTAAIAIGCSVIVPGDVPDFTCTGTSAAACPSGMVCDATRGKCVSLAAEEEGGTGDDGGDEAATDGGADADAGPAPVGSPCRVDKDCASRLCGTDTFLTPTMTQGTGPVCTQACCTSADCPAGTICFGAGTGGNYCVMAAKAQRSPPKTGGKTPGTTCGGNSECRSGLCDLGRCLDTCCNVNDCAAGTTCRVSTISAPAPPHDVWVCAPPPSQADASAGKTCAINENCYSDNCVGTSSRSCRPSCCSKTDCNQQLGSTTAHCAYSTSNTDQIKFCFLTTNTSGTANGGACGSDTECQSDFCDDGTGTCKSICCVDTDCVSTEACRPSPKGFLRCVPK